MSIRCGSAFFALQADAGSVLPQESFPLEEAQLSSPEVDSGLGPLTPSQSDGAMREADEGSSSLRSPRAPDNSPADVSNHPVVHPDIHVHGRIRGWLCIVLGIALRDCVHNKPSLRYSNARHGRAVNLLFKASGDSTRQVD